MFWLGDLNFRLTSDVTYDRALEMVKESRLKELCRYDQVMNLCETTFSLSLPYCRPAKSSDKAEDLPIKRKIFRCFYGVLKKNLPISQFILKFFRFFRTLLIIANTMHSRVVTMHRCIDASRYLGRRYMYRIATQVSRY